MSLLAALNTSSAEEYERLLSDADTCALGLAQHGNTWPSAQMCSQALWAVRETVLAKSASAQFGTVANPASTAHVACQTTHLPFVSSEATETPGPGASTDPLSQGETLGSLDAFWDAWDLETRFGWQGDFFVNSPLGAL